MLEVKERDNQRHLKNVVRLDLEHEILTSHHFAFLFLLQMEVDRPFQAAAADLLVWSNILCTMFIALHYGITTSPLTRGSG